MAPKEILKSEYQKKVEAEFAERRRRNEESFERMKRTLPHYQNRPSTTPQNQAASNMASQDKAPQSETPTSTTSTSETSTSATPTSATPTSATPTSATPTSATPTSATTASATPMRDTPPTETPPAGLSPASTPSDQTASDTTIPSHVFAGMSAKPPRRMKEVPNPLRPMRKSKNYKPELYDANAKAREAWEAERVRRIAEYQAQLAAESTGTKPETEAPQVQAPDALQASAPEASRPQSKAPEAPRPQGLTGAEKSRLEAEEARRQAAQAVKDKEFADFMEGLTGARPQPNEPQRPLIRPPGEGLRRGNQGAQQATAPSKQADVTPAHPPFLEHAKATRPCPATSQQTQVAPAHPPVLQQTEVAPVHPPVLQQTEVAPVHPPVLQQPAAVTTPHPSAVQQGEVTATHHPAAPQQAEVPQTHAQSAPHPGEWQQASVPQTHPVQPAAHPAAWPQAEVPQAQAVQPATVFQPQHHHHQVTIASQHYDQPLATAPSFPPLPPQPLAPAAADPDPPEPMAMDVDMEPLTDEQRYQQEIIRLRRRVADLERRADDDYHIIGDKDNHIKKQADEFKQQSNQLRDTNNALLEARSENRKLHEAAKEWERSAKGFKDQLAAQKNHEKHLQDSIASSKEEAKSAAAIHEAELEKFQETNDDLHKQLAEKKAVIQDLHGRLDAHKTSQLELDEALASNPAWQALEAAHEDVEKMFQDFGRGLTLDDFLQHAGDGGIGRRDSETSLDRTMSQGRQDTQRKKSLADELPSTPSEPAVDEEEEEDEVEVEDEDEDEADLTERNITVPAETSPTGFQIPGAFTISPISSVETSPTEPQAPMQETQGPATASAATQTAPPKPEPASLSFYGSPFAVSQRWKWARKRDQDLGIPEKPPHTIPKGPSPPMVPPTQAAQAPQTLTFSPITAVEMAPVPVPAPAPLPATRPRGRQSSLSEQLHAVPIWAQLLFFLLVIAVFVLMPSHVAAGLRRSRDFRFMEPAQITRHDILDFDEFMGLSRFTRASIWMNDLIGIGELFLG